MGRVIHDAVLHINNEQPLMADLFEMPATTDITLRCTNLRTLNGKRPVFADDQASIFYFPLAIIRFVEILPSSLTEEGDRPLVLAAGARNGRGPAEPAEPEPELEIDEDFLRRIREV